MNAVFTVLVALAALVGFAAPPRAERTVGDLKVEMTVAKAAYRPGDTVAVTLRVTNSAQKPIVVTTPGQQYDVIVRQRGALVWQWSHDKVFTQVVRDQPLAPGETLTFQERWDQRDLQGRPVDAGAYDISCVFLGAQRAGPATIEVGPVRISIGR